MTEEEKIKKYIDGAEKELRELFNDLIYEHGDNGGQYEIHNRASGFNTLLKYARKWQKYQESGLTASEAIDALLAGMIRGFTYRPDEITTKGEKN